MCNLLLLASMALTGHGHAYLCTYDAFADSRRKGELTDLFVIR